MNTAGKPPTGPDRRTARPKEDLAHELEILAKRLADSRDALVEILARASYDGVNGATPTSTAESRSRLVATQPPAAARPVASVAPQSGIAGKPLRSRRGLIALVLVAVGAVFLLTGLVSVL